MEVHAYDPYPSRCESTGREHKTVDALFSNCTHVSIHCNLTDETHHLVNAERLASMPHVAKMGPDAALHHQLRTGWNCGRAGRP